MGTIAGLTRRLLGTHAAALALASTLAVACAASSDSNERNVRVVKNQETAAETGGISPDKEAEVQLLLQQREPSTLRCYQDVLDEKHDRAFKGTVIVLISLTPVDAQSSKGSAKVTGGTLNNKDVSDCLIDKLNAFDYPSVPQTGTMQYVYRFEPAY
jgi:hypothetical protein